MRQNESTPTAQMISHRKDLARRSCTMSPVCAVKDLDIVCWECCQCTLSRQTARQDANLPSSLSSQAAQSPFARHPYHQKERFNDLPEDARKLIEELE